MNTLLRFIVALWLAAGAVSPAAAQITITAADFAGAFVPGAMFTSHVDTLAVRADIGSTGATSWDFSALGANRIQSATVVRPDTTPFAGFFPGATHALRSIAAGAVSYSYFSLGTDLLFRGIGSAGIYTSRIVYEPAEVQYRFPLTMGSSWTTACVESLVVVLPPPLPPQVILNNVTVTSKVDAYGPLTLPGGGVQQALRVRTDRRSGAGANASRLISYTFIARNSATVGVVAADTLQPDHGVIAVSNVSWSGAVATDVPAGGIHPSGFAIAGNHPNPFFPSTSIRFFLPRAAFVTLTVRDALGREVARLARGELPAGSHTAAFDGSGLPNGAYFCTLQTPEGSVTKSMLLLR